MASVKLSSILIFKLDIDFKPSSSRDWFVGLCIEIAQLADIIQKCTTYNMYLLFTMKLCWLCRLEYIFKRLHSALLILGSAPMQKQKFFYSQPEKNFSFTQAHLIQLAFGLWLKNPSLSLPSQAQIEFKPNSIWGNMDSSSAGARHACSSSAC